jgi:hypothetical protein
LPCTGRTGSPTAFRTASSISTCADYDPSGEATPPTTAIGDFLNALHVPPHRIPDGPAAQAGLYRSLLANRRLLVLLDNARDTAQVTPLLPGAPGCLVLVTSRDHLAGLVTAYGAHPLTLDLLPPDGARRLLASRLARTGSPPSPPPPRRSSAAAPGCRWHWRLSPPAPRSNPRIRSARWPASSGTP